MLQRPKMSLEGVGKERLRLICGMIAESLDSPSYEQCAQVLEALHVSVVATREWATIRGVLPTEVPKFISTGRTSGCLFDCDKPGEGLPFIGRVRLSRATM